MDVDMERIRELIELLKSAEISELTVKTADSSITVRRTLPASSVERPDSLTASMETLESADGMATGPTAEAERPEQQGPAFETVTSPMVGTVRLSPRPGAESARAGQRVGAGDILCIIESMKVPNEVRAPAPGVIAQVLVEEGEPVDFGQELLVLETSPE